MTAGHVFRHAPRKGVKLVGYQPLAGQPRDPEGRLILDWIYQATGIADVVDQAMKSPINMVTVEDGKMKVEPIAEADFFK